MNSTITLTLVFTAITVIMSMIAWRNESLMRSWIMNPPQVSQGHEYYRFITSGFIHADWGHLIFNMFTFYSFGSQLESIFGQIFGDAGRIYFGVLYILGIIVSDIPSYLKHKNDANYNTLGASGGVSAVVFASILFFPTGTLYVYFIPMPAIIFAALFFIYSIYQMRKGTDNINHSAHLWGAVFGVLFVMIAYPDAINIFMEAMKEWRILN